MTNIQVVAADRSSRPQTHLSKFPPVGVVASALMRTALAPVDTTPFTLPVVVSPAFTVVDGGRRCSRSCR